MGPAQAKLFARAIGGERVIDLLFHLPDGYVDRRARRSIAETRAIAGSEGAAVTTWAIEVVRHEKPASPRQPWRVVVTDGTGFAELVFFGHTALERMPPGAKLLVSGRADRYGERVQMANPDHVVPADRPERLPAIEPVWRLTAGLFPRRMAAAMAEAVRALPDTPEWHTPLLLRQTGFPGFSAALRSVQAPDEAADPSRVGEAARRRLAFDELLAGQIALAIARRQVRARPGRALLGDGHLRARALSRFGHALTPAQSAALAEIDADLASPRRMLRLLQGDVGSGKTIVALMAMLRAVEAGAQAALMAPTEVLARQHWRTLGRLAPVPVALLTGSVTGAARAKVLRGLADGTLPIVVGTHALVQEAVTFRDLGLAVIDEQHRFGVDQRVVLGAKGATADVLTMTATPIPRTLLLTRWGEMAVSRLAGKPAGRAPIRTTIHALTGLPAVLDAIGRRLAAGGRAYWVCPLVAESEATDIAAAEARFALLRARFGDAVVLAHGQQATEARDAALAAFAAGTAQLLVTTTVVEVGVDVPEASVMVIDHADRFGLAQLHQLRGRVGRGTEQSFCLLLHDEPMSETARARLALLRDTEDGFVIADADFRLRGGGDVLGTRQSGAREFRLAHPVDHEELLVLAAREAASVVEADPRLTGARGPALRLLLRLFDQMAAMATLRGG